LIKGSVDACLRGVAALKEAFSLIVMRRAEWSLKFRKTIKMWNFFICGGPKEWSNAKTIEADPY
jgi:hypothetical protein